MVKDYLIKKFVNAKPNYLILMHDVKKTYYYIIKENDPWFIENVPLKK